MSYFKEFPLVEYPSRDIDQSSNEDYVRVINLFRRAKIREDVLNAVTAFNLYQIKDGERPDRLAEKIYGDSELDWILYITNNLTNVTSKWPLANSNFYDYLIDKYETEENLENIEYVETTEVRDEFDRLVVPEKLKIDTDSYQEFTTFKNKDDFLFYNLDFYPVPSKYKDLEITSNLGQYLEVWERDNLQEGQSYTGEKYLLDEVRLLQEENPDEYGITETILPEYARSDFSYLFVHSRLNEIKYIYSPVTLKGWPGTWGGEMPIYLRDENLNSFNAVLNPVIGKPVNITDDFRLYTIFSAQSVGEFSYTSGTTLAEEANKNYVVYNPKSNRDGKNSKFEIKRNSLGEVIDIKVLDGGRDYIKSEVITILGSSIGGVDIIDDITITITEILVKPQFRFISIE